MNQRVDIHSRNIVLGRGLAPVPERLLLAHARGEVLFIAGAGVSRDAGLPDFLELVVKVYEKLDPVVHSVINNSQAPQDLTDDQQAEVKRFCKGEYDVVLGMLERRIEGQEEAQSLVRQQVGNILRPTGLKPAPIHRALMRLSDRGGTATIITTNFDLLFEKAASNMRFPFPIQTYALSGIPRPTQRAKFSGVLHIHGALDRNPQRTSDLIVSDQDFGEFYLRRRIASDLIYDAARLYNLVLVGYSANDPPMRYLLSAVTADTAHFRDLKERFIFVGMSEDDPVELADWRARGITPIQYAIQGDDHAQLQRTLAQWAKFSVFNSNTRPIDSTLKKIVQSKRADASQDNRGLFDHFIRRSSIDPNKRDRLIALLSDYQANLEWVKAALDVFWEESEGVVDETAPASLNARDRAKMRSTVAFFKGRLETKETIEWALDFGPNDILKRRAILHLLNTSEGIDLREPWRSAWRLIEEFWDEPVLDHYGQLDVYNVQKRLRSGERSGALVSAIVDLVAPRLSVEAYESWELQFYKPPKRPKTFFDLFQARLTSGEIVDPAFLGLQKLTKGEFLISLANALDAAVLRGLDIARRIGWGPHLLLKRVYYVSESNGKEKDDPDKFVRGIAPSVKLLYSVVSRIVDIDRFAALGFISRWKWKDSPIHLRLWAAMSRDSRITPAAEVGDFILHLKKEVFWDVRYYPEIAELCARHFSELDDATQKAITQKIRKGPSRHLWPKNAEMDRIEENRLCWIVRELKRIEVAGATLPQRDKIWLESNIERFPDLAKMNRIDEGFWEAPKVRSVQENPDRSLDSLKGIARLQALEQKLSAPRRVWDDDPASRARDWIREEGNPMRVLRDLESSPDGGAKFPQVWEHLGWAHSSSENQIQKTCVRTLLVLLEKLPQKTLSQAIQGISQWLSCWKKDIVVAPEWPVVWHRVWPLAVEATNAMQPSNQEPDLNIVSPGASDRPADLDTLNPPAGKLVGVFFAARPNLGKNPRPFDDASHLRKMRNDVINAPGRSGLIAKHRMIEELSYFLRADREWTKKHLIRPLRGDDADALDLWHAVSRQTQFKDILEIIGDDMVERTRDDQLDRDTRHSLAFSLVVENLHALREGRDPAVAQDRIQQMIRLLEAEVRTYCVEAITRFVSDLSEKNEHSPECLFKAAVKPFLQQVWPQDRSLVSPGISDRLSKLPALTRSEFANAVDTIERFLMPFDCWTISGYGLYGGDEDDGKPRLSMIDDEAKAEALLRLLDRTVGTADNAVIPYDLGDALEQVRKVAPDLARDQRYRRLATAARRV